MKIYQVFIFDKIPEIFFFKSKNINDLFINKDYICIFKEGRLFYYQKINSHENIDELKKLIEEKLNLDFLHTIESKEIEFNQSNDYIFFKPVKSNIFKFFILYMLFLCLGFYFFEFNETKQKDELNLIQNNILLLKKTIKFEPLSDDVAFLYHKAKSNKLLIESLSFKDSKFFLNLKSTKKQNIYEFLKSLNGNIEHINFDEKTKEYLANASFKVYRR